MCSKLGQFFDSFFVICETWQARVAGALLLALFNLFSKSVLATFLLGSIWFLLVWALKHANVRTWKLLCIAMALAVVMSLFWPPIKKGVYYSDPKQERAQMPITENHKPVDEVLKPEIGALKSKLTLLDLFERDNFSSLLKSSRDRKLESKDGNKVTIKTQVYLDFQSQTKFLGFYIPSDLKTFEICQSILGIYEDVLRHNSNMLVESKSLGEQPINSSELKFSGRIFIYHEYPLLYQQQIELHQLFKAHGLGVQFRGSDYLWEKKKAGAKHEQ